MALTESSLAGVGRRPARWCGRLARPAPAAACFSVSTERATIATSTPSSASSTRDRPCRCRGCRQSRWRSCLRVPGPYVCRLAYRRRPTPCNGDPSSSDDCDMGFRSPDVPVIPRDPPDHAAKPPVARPAPCCVRHRGRHVDHVRRARRRASTRQPPSTAGRHYGFNIVAPAVGLADARAAARAALRLGAGQRERAADAASSGRRCRLASTASTSPSAERRAAVAGCCRARSPSSARRSSRTS